MTCWNVIPRAARRHLGQRIKLPLYVTENGCASKDQDFRINDLKEHPHQLQLTMPEGVDVRGFYYWSLLDNVEWQFGYTKKFGLLSVDFSNLNLPSEMTSLAHF